MPTRNSNNLSLFALLGGLWIGCIIVIEYLLMTVPRFWNIGIILFVVLISGLVLFKKLEMNLAKRDHELADTRLAMRETAVAMETIIDSIDAPILMVDGRGLITQLNSSMEKLSGRSKMQLIGYPLDLFVQELGIKSEDGHFYSRETFPLFKVLQGQQADSEIVVLNNLERQNYFILSVNPAIDQESEQALGAIALFKDITELKMLDQMKDEFIGIVSHELKTPLAVIRGFSQLQLMYAKKRQATIKQLGLNTMSQDLIDLINDESCMKKIMSEIDLMAGMIDQMVNITRIDSGKYQLCQKSSNLILIIEEVISTFTVSLGPDRILFVDESPDGLRANLDPNALRQILNNLISNAAKYSPKDTAIKVSLFQKDDQACVTVQDQGIGIPFSEQQSVFSKFYRTSGASHADSEGLGLGLYITARLVEMQGGKISLESEPGKGTTFSVRFPMTSTYSYEKAN